MISTVNRYLPILPKERSISTKYIIDNLAYIAINKLYLENLNYWEGAIVPVELYLL